MDLNSDIGESYGVWRLGDDEGMLDIVTSANIACGFHAGDPSTLRRVCQRAADRDVRIGAQVSYPDLLGFGRRHVVIDPGELRDLILYQLGALDAFARAAGSRVTYVKPHGALYHATIADPLQAAAVVDAVLEFDAGLAVVGLPHSSLLDRAGSAGLRPIREAFADRAYTASGDLVARSTPGAVLTDPELIVRRVMRLVGDGTLEAADGSIISLAADTVCIHGDTPDAALIAAAVRAGLEQAGIDLHPFT